MRMIINCKYTYILCDINLRVTNYIQYDKNVPIKKVIIIVCSGVLPGIILVSYNTRLTFFAPSGLFLRLTQFGDLQTRDSSSVLDTIVNLINMLNAVGKLTYRVVWQV